MPRVTRRDPGWLLPIRSVGVKGDSRSYHSVLALENVPDDDIATELVNAMPDINRVVGLVRAHASLAGMQSSPGTLTHERLDRLRHADAIVRQLSEESGFEHRVWQFPVVLIPIGTPERRIPSCCGPFIPSTA